MTGDGTPHQSAGAAGRVLSVNVGSIRIITWQGRTEPTGIWKSPVAGRVLVRGENLAGDDQADRRAHGGPNKAVYAYAREDAEWWEGELWRPVAPGEFGENLTLAGVEVTHAVIGERWTIGSAVVEVAQPRIPCWKLGARMQDPMFPKRFAAAGRPGAYLRIIQGGDVGAGDEVEMIHRPAHGLTVGQVAHIYLRAPAHAGRLLAVSELPEKWHAWARETIGSLRMDPMDA
jgi:MOSC domain-containing protein YiiM